MANETVQSGLTALAQVAVAEARSTFENLSRLSNFVRRANVAPGQISVRFPSTGALTASALTDGSAAANQQFQASGVVLTPATKAVVSTTITKLADWAGANQLAVEFGREAATAIIKKENADIWALFDGFSAAVGSANTAITEAAIVQARNKIRNTGVGGDIILAVTPNVMGEIFKIFANKSGYFPQQIADAVYAGQAPSLFGVRLVEVNGINDNYAENVKCGMFNSNAIGYAQAWDINVDIAPRPSSVGYEITASAAYEVAELQDSLGVEILCANGPTYTP
jgi:hypothetical protein